MAHRTEDRGALIKLLSEKINAPDALYYLNPPYVPATRRFFLLFLHHQKYVATGEIGCTTIYRNTFDLNIVPCFSDG